MIPVAILYPLKLPQMHLLAGMAENSTLIVIFTVIQENTDIKETV